MSSVVPDGWSIEKIEDITKDKKGAIKIGPFGSALSKKEMVSKGIKVFGQENVYRKNFSVGSYYITEEKYASLKSCTLEQGDVVVSMMGTVGASAIFPEGAEIGVMDSHLLRIQVNLQTITSEFLRRQISDYEWVSRQIERMSQGGIMSGLNAAIVKSVKVVIPPLPEQKKIASILTSVDKVIENTQQQIDKLQDLKKATMNELLTKGIGHTEFKDSELGRIPKSWEIKKVSQFTKEHKQGFYTKDGYQGNGVFLIRITDLQNPKINYSEMPKLPVSEKDFTSFKVDVGDFLFARSGAIGRYGIVSENYPAVFASYLIRFKFNDTVYTKFFGYMYESECCQNQLSYITQGSSNININAENIKSLTVPYPSLVEQRKIASVLLSIDKNIEDKHHKLSQTQSLKKSLMQDLLTGKVRVTVS